ncbi:MAG: chromosomal replication initiator DnaA [Alphaproteobacteria bacterium]|nr:MAG: chromosomal replication initiator DnaA [Alphaproteobacteria bacterium]
MSDPTRQLAIDLPPRPAHGRADFLASECNRAALERIDRWPDWPGRRLVLYGPASSGKSHLARLWCAESGARYVPARDLASELPLANGALPPAMVVDDAEAASERALLHLFNSCAEAGTALLVVSRNAPAAWAIDLPDLASRLRAMPAVGIDMPDDALLAAVLVKHFADRQLRIAPSVIGYIVPRMERSFAMAASLAARLDELALAGGRSIGLALARQALAELGAETA